MRFDKYQDNLHVDGNKVYSYNTHVATIEGGNLVKLGYWSKTTSKHINYAAEQLGLRVVEQSPEAKAAAKQEEERGASSFLKSVGMVAMMGELLATSPDNSAEQNKAAANDWKARMLRAGMGAGLQMPEDWGTLSEEEKERRLNGVIAVTQEKQPEREEVFLNELLDKGIEVSTERRASLAALLGSGCQSRNKQRVRSVCLYSLESAFRGKWFAGRLYFRGDVAHYCAGQSYPDEIRSIRKEII